MRKELKKLGKKTGQLVGEKIYEKFSTKRAEAGPSEPMRREADPKGAEFPSEAPQSGETKGKEIGKMLAASKPTPPDKNKFQKINNVYADLL